MQSGVSMDFKSLQQKEKKLLAHLYASVADILDVVGAKELTALLSKKVAEVICERSLQLETNLALLSLLEDLSGWSVSIIRTNVLKGTLERRSVEMKVGRIPDFTDPLVVVDDLLAHGHVMKERKLGMDILPPSPPPDASDVYLRQEEDKEEPVDFSTSPHESAMSISLDSFRNLSPVVDCILTPVSSSFGDDIEILSHQVLSPDPDKGLESPELMGGSDKALLKIDDVPSHKLPLLTKNNKKALNDISTVTSTEVSIDTADNNNNNNNNNTVTVRGLYRDCKNAVLEIKRLLNSPPVQEGKIYSLPSWMSGQKFSEQIQQIAATEGCVIEEMIGTKSNMPIVFIQSERGWNIRRCIDRLQELEDQCTLEYGCWATNTTTETPLPTSIAEDSDKNDADSCWGIMSKEKTILISSSVADRISYDRSQLLQVRSSSSLTLQPVNQSPLLNELMENAQSLNIILTTDDQ